MDIWILDRNLDPVKIIDAYESLIWAERYYEHGDFEIHTDASEEILSHVRQDYYAQIHDSDHVMVINELLIESHAETGNKLVISGDSLESILKRRIVWGQITLSGNLQTAIQTLLNTSVINPSDADRKIDNFIFRMSTDPIVTSLKVDAQYTGDNVYDIVQKLCKDNDIGFKITLENKKFVFQLYAGVDRSYAQLKNPYVVFSPEFDNLVGSNYLETKSGYKNVALIGGEDATEKYYETDNDSGTTAYISDDGTVRKYVSVGSGVGLDRRELFVDARDISSEVDDKKLSDGEYAELLKQRGKEKLDENPDIKSFEGEIEHNGMFKLRKDYFNGDIVQIANEYGHSAKVRIIEIVTSDEGSGMSVTPTFVTIPEEGE